MNRLILLILMLFSIGWMGVVPRDVVDRARLLNEVLREADEAYYIRNDPILSDDAYDALQEQYRVLIEDFPQLSGTENLGFLLPRTDRTVLHQFPILSLMKAYSDGEVLSFVEKCGTPQEFCVQPKIDGVSIVLHYENGVLQKAVTRGDGKFGCDVSPAIFLSGAVPLKLKSSENWIVRGELFMKFSDFAAFNANRLREKLEPLKSPRNTVAGTLRLKNFAELSKRKLSFLAFELVDCDIYPAKNSDALAKIKSAGLSVVESEIVKDSELLNAVDSCRKSLIDADFPCDGVVIKLNNLQRFNDMGQTMKYPRGAIARKWQEKPVETKLLRVDWQRSEKGRLTPVAIFEPVYIGGAKIQRATLHNFNYINALDLKIGDRINVIRSGGTIPEIIKVLRHKRDGSERSIENFSE